MENKKYESPRFEFQGLKLMERVAETCWGNKVAFVDFNGNGKFEDFEGVYHMTDSGCEGNEQSVLMKRFDDLIAYCKASHDDCALAYGVEGFSESDVKTNVKASKYIKPSFS